MVDLKMADSRNDTPTTKTYSEIQLAYDVFNKELFDGALPECVITLESRFKKRAEYFAAERFIRIGERSESEYSDGLCLNPTTFTSRDIMSVLSTLAHEMCHVWEYHKTPKPSRSGYHNRRWGAKMEEIGLMPSDTGLPGGKKTGQRMTHYIIRGGRFEVSASRLIAEKFKISWGEEKNEMKRKIALLNSKKSKTKYTCQSCGANIWGKSGLKVICGTCKKTYVEQEEFESIILSEKSV
jgi:predicted SprT family Zn-dependent metalloprotease